ncbi:unnamed protein product, partial [Didymodactylos carnosus]
NDNYFWICLIRNQFGSMLYKRYVYDVFDDKMINSDFNLYRTTADEKRFMKMYKQRKKYDITFWFHYYLCMDDNSNGYSGRQRANWFSLKERCHQLNMSMTIENFRTDLNYYQFKGNSNQCVDNNNNYLKLLYFHLSDCKRLLGKLSTTAVK